MTEADDRFELYMELSLYRKAADTAIKMKDAARLQEVIAVNYDPFSLLSDTLDFSRFHEAFSFIEDVICVYLFNHFRSSLHPQSCSIVLLGGSHVQRSQVALTSTGSSHQIILILLAYIVDFNCNFLKILSCHKA